MLMTDLHVEPWDTCQRVQKDKDPLNVFWRVLKDDKDLTKMLAIIITEFYKDLCNIVGTSKSLKMLECISLNIAEDLSRSNFEEHD